MSSLRNLVGLSACMVRTLREEVLRVLIARQNGHDQVGGHVGGWVVDW